MLIAELFSFSAFAVAPASRHCPSCGRLTDLHNRAPSRQRRHTLKGRSGGLGAELEAHACRSSSLISQLWPAAQRPPAGTPPSAAPLPSAQDWPCATARRGAIAALAASSVAEPRIAIRRARSASSLAGRLARSVAAAAFAASAAAAPPRPRLTLVPADAPSTTRITHTIILGTAPHGIMRR